MMIKNQKDLKSGLAPAMTMTMTMTLGLVFFGGMINNSRAIITLDDKPNSLYLDLASSPFLSPVGKLSSSFAAGSFLSTAVLVAPQWVLAAGHTVSRGDSTLQALEFTLGGIAYSGIAESVVVFPGFNPNLDPSGNYGVDISLFQLNQPITTITPAKIGNALPAEGTLSVFGGYGRQGNGLTGDIFAAGNFLAAENNIDVVDPVGNVFFTDFDNPPGTASIIGGIFPVTLEGGVAPGDSGVPFFVQYDNGEWGVVGILSGFGNLDGEPEMKYGDFSISTGVAGATEWMVDSGANISIIPEPRTAILLLIAGGAVLLRARISP